MAKPTVIVVTVSAPKIVANKKLLPNANTSDTMKTLHENNPDNENADSNESKSGLSYNRPPLRQYSLGHKEIKAYTELGLILRRIHKRIATEKAELKNNQGNTNQENKSESPSR